MFNWFKKMKTKEPTGMPYFIRITAFDISGRQHYLNEVTVELTDHALREPYKELEPIFMAATKKLARCLPKTQTTDEAAAEGEK